ncbi:hypothetical protein GGI15_001483 [Coemansia interrupta]|uniref:Uncharacterized protein n=1 Tax=Coemansia interrupta TaxID=1126814 RepID=A0A9W8HHW0_9FUNG|nr:hypothetical protein GGI15_001483 [Coemansia interrupta]
MCTGDDDATVEESTFVALGSILTGFLSTVLRESISVAIIAKGVNYTDGNSKFRLALHEDVVAESLRMCGYGEYVRTEENPAAGLMDRLITEYIDDTVASTLLPELESLSAASAAAGDSEDDGGISTGSDHD